MGKAFKCDRCNGLFDEPPSRDIEEFPGGWGEPIKPHAREATYELCEDCADAFDRFMDCHYVLGEEVNMGEQ